MNNSVNQTIIFRKSHIILISRLFFLELIFILLYLFVRIPKSIILSIFTNFSGNQLLNILGVIYFIFLSIIEMLFVLQITLDWTNEEYEIREGSIIHRKGIFNRKEEIYSLRNLGSTRIIQDFFGKIMNYGTIIISSPILKNEIYLHSVPNPRAIVKNLEDDIENRAIQGGIIRRLK